MTEYSLILFPEQQSDLEYLIDLSLHVNQRAGTNELLLNGHSRLPHVTLTMLYAEESSELMKEDLIGEKATVKLKTETVTYSPSSGQDIQWAVPESIEMLEKLHSAAMRLRERYHRRTSATKAKCGWIDRFDEHSGDQYQPHFTLGYSSQPFSTDGRDIRCRVALAELGPRCTVQHVLS